MYLLVLTERNHTNDYRQFHTQGLIIIVYLGIVLLTTAAMSLGYNLARRVYAKSGEVL